MENITEYILAVFFGLFMINGIIKFYFYRGLSQLHSILWFISAILFANSMGVILN